ncbi:hypothetical protein [Dyella sp.]|uniref:hypothetical protein n=1 Tax=Dyella sp. TaxID=1869338 RepID=UPI00284C7008|nr:hypothetical protein [Dyella sp.]MDR3443704.1 hypothetical protein [Dyella sp.]
MPERNQRKGTSGLSPLKIGQGEFLRSNVFVSWSPKLDREIRLIGPSAFDAWLIIEFDPDIVDFCERPPLDLCLSQNDDKVKYGKQGAHQGSAGPSIILHNIHYAKSCGRPCGWHGPGLVAFSDARKAPMPRRHNRLNWLYDNDLQRFTTPCGRTITLAEIAQLLQDRVTCHHDFAGPWTGWRMRQNRLIAPGSTFKTANITADTLRAFSRWLRSFEGEQAQLEFDKDRCAHQANTQPASAPEFVDKAPRANTEHHPLIPLEAVTAHPEQERAAHEPRRRAAVIDLAAYRRRLAAQG